MTPSTFLTRVRPDHAEHFAKTVDECSRGKSWFAHMRYAVVIICMSAACGRQGGAHTSEAVKAAMQRRGARALDGPPPLSHLIAPLVRDGQPLHLLIEPPHALLADEVRLLERRARRALLRVSKQVRIAGRRVAGRVRVVGSSAPAAVLVAEKVVEVVCRERAGRACAATAAASDARARSRPASALTRLRAARAARKEVVCHDVSVCRFGPLGRRLSH